MAEFHYHNTSTSCKGQHTHRFDLTSLDDPTEEQLQFIMEQVGIAARESSRKAKEELDRRMRETIAIMNS